MAGLSSFLCSSVCVRVPRADERATRVSAMCVPGADERATLVSDVCAWTFLRLWSAAERVGPRADARSFPESAGR